MSANDAAMPSPPACPLINTKFDYLQEDRFRFTPVKTTRDVPRDWDRKPSTPFLSHPRSRKVWKRFRSSFNSMKALQRFIATEQDSIDEDFYLAEINTSRHEAGLRGVKRRCFSLEENADETTPRERSFLETKWEPNIHSGRRRKIPTKCGLVDETGPMAVEMPQPSEAQDEISEDEMASDTSTLVAQNPTEATALAPLVAYPRLLHGQSSDAPSETDETAANIKETVEILSPQNNLLGSHSRDELDLTDPTATTTTEAEDAALDATITDDQHVEHLEEQPSADENITVDDPSAAAADAFAPVQDLTAEQESTLVRSALRSSLDGEDATLINNFLSKAKAKREAKANLVTTETEAGNTSSPTETEVIEMPTPPPRRALENLDANSPSPQKSQFSPIKGHPKEKDAKEKDVPENDEQLPASPRRSTRKTNSKRLRSRPGVIHNTWSLRRSNGTEFVFLQRSEAQELALATKRNTQKNKGESVAPKARLQKLARPSAESEKEVTDDDKSAQNGGQPVAAKKKRVSWNEQLVEYEGGQKGATTHPDDGGGSRDRSPNHRSEKRKATSRRITRSQGSPESGGDGASSASTTASATATPRTRRVRRLGTPKSSATAAVASLESSPSSLSPSPEKRKKLTPLSPRTTLLGPSTSKKVSSRGTSKSSESSSSGKSASLFQAHAGSTPVPRRVRSRG